MIEFEILYRRHSEPFIPQLHRDQRETITQARDAAYFEIETRLDGCTIISLELFDRGRNARRARIWSIEFNKAQPCIG